MTKQPVLKRLAGYTLDQTILIVAVIAILVTIIVGSVGWEVLNRASSAKIAAHLKQIETAVGVYYKENNNTWPTSASVLEEFLPGYRASGSNLRTTLSSGSSDAVMSLTTASGYIQVAITNIAAQEAEEADKTVDDSDGRTAGRLTWGSGSGSDSVTITFRAVRRF